MKKLLLVFYILFFALNLSAKKIVIYHTSDTHGAFYPQNGIGGFAALKALVDKEPLPFILLDSGDFGEGYLEATRSKGIKSIEMMNAVGYSGATLGNHDFYFGDDGVNNMLSKAKFPIIAANVYKGDKLLDGLVPHKIFDIGGAKIGVIGIAKEGGKTSYKVTLPGSAMKKALPKLEAEHPDVVVALVHWTMYDGWSPRKDSTDIFSEGLFEGRINIVLGGHAHKNIFKQVNGTYYVESGAHVENVSRIVLDIDDKTNKLLSVKKEYIALDTKVTSEDARVKELAAAMRVQGVDEPLGMCAELITQRTTQADCADSPADNLLADIMLAYAKPYGAQIALISVGATAGDFNKGPVTKRNILEVYPHPEDEIMMAEVTGAFLKTLVRGNIVPGGVSKLNYAGIEVKYRLLNKKPKDIIITINGEEVDGDKKYRIAATSFIFSGVGTFWQFAKIPSDKKNVLGTKTLVELVEDSLKTGTALRAPEVCRMRIVK